jgi:hypothetical protein
MKKFKEYFNVILNPFTKEIRATHHTSKSETYEKELSYQEIDEWQSFKIDGAVFDLHILYDEKLTVSIYRINEDFPDCYTDSIKVNLTIKLTEK